MITYDINVLIGADDSTKKAHVKCNDSGVNLRVFLKTRKQLSDVRYQDIAYTISENTTAVLRINKPDGHYVLQDGQASADSVFFALHPQAFTSPGMLTAEVSLYDAELRRITTADFFIETTPECISDSSEESKTYIDILAQKIHAINNAETSAGESAQAAKRYASDAVTSAESAEKAKIDAEEAKKEAKYWTDAARDASSSAEAAKGNAETARDQAYQAAAACTQYVGVADRSAKAAQAASDTAVQKASAAGNAAEDANKAKQAAETAVTHPPVIGDNGNYFVWDNASNKYIDSGVIAFINGDSAYDIAVKNGFVGSENEWLESIKGDKGDKGDNGEITHADLTAKPVNLCNPDSALAGYGISTNPSGMAVVSANYTAFNFIPAKGNTTYCVSYDSKGVRKLPTAGVIAAYDEDKICLNAVALKTNNPYTTPENTAYIRFSLYNTETNKPQVEEARYIDGVLVPHEYEEYALYKDPAVDSLAKGIVKEVFAENERRNITIPDNATANTINGILSAIVTTDLGTISFPAGKTIVLDEGIDVAGRKNVVIDLNGCTLKLGSAFTKPASKRASGIDKTIMLGVSNCENVTIKNGVFDCDYQTNNLDGYICLETYSSSVTIENCVFKNSNYHHIFVWNGYCDGENIDFINLANKDQASDVYTTATDGGRVETHWRGIRSTRQDYAAQVFYFGVTSDTQENYHTVDGLTANKCGNVIDLRGGEGVFRNIYVEDVLDGIHVHKINTTFANAPIVTFENVHFKDCKPTRQAPITVYCGRRVHIRNVFVEAENWTPNPDNDVSRALDVNGWYNTDENKPEPVRDVIIENFRYTGIPLKFGLCVAKDVQCLLNNITIDADVNNAGILFINETPNTSVSLSNYDCANKSISCVSNGTVSADPKHIRMKNTHQAIGTKAERPELFPCETGMYYDTDLGKMVYWNGTAWIEP